MNALDEVEALERRDRVPGALYNAKQDLPLNVPPPTQILRAPHRSS
jgi:hypothetical protein